MKTVSLGKQGLKVPAIGLGCMGMSDFYGGGDEQTCLSLLDEALELGCNFWDTSDMYGPFTNEMLLGKALIGRRSDVILATKFGVQRAANGDWIGINGSPEYVTKSCDASLQRLGTTYIDLYYQHRPDPRVPIEETVGAMADLVAAGKVRYLGLSEVDAVDLEKANRVHPITALQTEFSLWTRDVEQQILPKARDLGIGFVAYSPLGRGFLTGKIQNRNDLQEGDWRLTNPRFSEQAINQNLELVNLVEAMAAEHGVTSSQVALAWLLARGDDIAAIPGTRHSKYLNFNWQSQDIHLSSESLAVLDKYSESFKVSGERY